MTEQARANIQPGVVAKCTQFPGGGDNLRRSRSRRQVAASDSSANATDSTVGDGDSLLYFDDAVIGDELSKELAHVDQILEGFGTSGPGQGQDSVAQVT